MESTLFKKFENITPTKGATSKRASIIEEFVTEINKERPCTYKDKNGIKRKLGKVKAKEIAVRLSHLKENDLTYFLSECKDYRNRNGSFTKRFFGSLK